MRRATQEKTRLITDGIKYANFVTFIHLCKDNIDDDIVSRRYRFGELCLTRLNFWCKIFLFKVRYQKVEWQYGAYFARYYAPILFVFAMFSLVVSSMQLVLAVRTVLEPDDAWLVFARVGRGFALFTIFSVACVIVGLVALLVLSMVRDQNAARYYMYLSDISEESQQPELAWENAFQESKWFTRGWTLQELLAPAKVEFFGKQGRRLGDKRSLEQQIHEITGIARPALQGKTLATFDVEARFKWAETRQTTCEEDWAYCLLGIFGIFIPLIYGEGKAVRRIKKKIASAMNRNDTPSHQGGMPCSSLSFSLSQFIIFYMLIRHSYTEALDGSIRTQ